MAKLERENVPFTQIANAVLCDPNLSWSAKGIFAYMFSKPDDWDFAADRMAREGKRQKTEGGVKDIRSRLRELQIAGYLSVKKCPSGRIKYFLKFSIDPKVPTGSLANQKPEVPTGSQPLGLPASGAPINNKELLTNTKLITNKEFNWTEVSEDMMKKEGSDMDIIASFLIEKKLVPQDSPQLTGYIKRYRKIAKDIVPFVGTDFKKFWKAVEICKEESYRLGYDWDLTTIYKKITKI